MKHRIPILLSIIVILSLAGCGQSATFRTSKDVSTGEITIRAENSYDGTDNGLITVKEGECLVFSPSIIQGAIHTTVTKEESTDSIVFEADLSGHVYRSEKVDPGNYQLFVSSRDGATGVLRIFSIREEELEKQKDQDEIQVESTESTE